MYINYSFQMHGFTVYLYGKKKKKEKYKYVKYGH